MPSPTPPGFIDRERELEELRRLADQGRPALLLVYGRRRVGKTFLLDHAWEGRRAFYFLAADSTAALNRAEILRELAAWSGHDLNPEDYPSWRTVFRLFVDLAAEGPIVVVLDEFQYLMGYEDDVVSQLVAVWDREVRDRPLVLALSGSEVATMEQLQHGGQPLYGRPSWSARIRSFDYRDAARMTPAFTQREAAALYGVFGGTPRYLASIAESDLETSVVRNVLSPRGEVHLQIQNIIEQEKGIREPAEYRAVLAAIAAGRTDVNDIALAAGLGERPHVVRRALAVLEGLEIIRRERNFDAPAKARYQYGISDNAVRFWYTFVHPNRSRLETGDPVEVWAHRVAPYLNDYMGKVFEGMCRQAYDRYHARWGVPGAARWARWEGRDRNRRSIEIDLVARLDDGRILTGEIKWSSQPVGYELHTGLMRNLEDLSRSGQGWASDALSDGRSAGHMYFSAAGFTDEFRQRASEPDAVRLITLDELYPPD
jgi:AAA+ ATPase superfamily predicted ATPase